MNVFSKDQSVTSPAAKLRDYSNTMMILECVESKVASNGVTQSVRGRSRPELGRRWFGISVPMTE